MQEDDELEMARKTVRRLQEDIASYEARLPGEVEDAKIQQLLKRSASRRDDDDDDDGADEHSSDTDDDEYDERQAQQLRELREQGDALTKLRDEAEAKLALLRAGQQTADRAQPMVLTEAPLRAQRMQDYFGRFGNARVDPAATLPPAFATQCLGGGLQTPGAVRAAVPVETTETELRRLHETNSLLLAALSVAQSNVQSMSRCVMAAEQRGRFNTPPTETFMPHELSAQMRSIVGDMKPCSSGATCVAMTLLPVHPTLGRRVPLKQFQSRSTFEAFKNSGKWLTIGSTVPRLDRCVPCMLFAWKTAIFSKMPLQTAHTELRFPLTVVQGRPGGFRNSAIVPCDRLPVAWPNLDPHHFVPVVQDFEWYTTDRTGVRVKHTETVYGYDFSDAVLFDASTLSCGTDQYQRLSMHRPLITTTQQVGDTPLPATLAIDVEQALAIELSREEELSETVETLLTEFEFTLRFAHSADSAMASARAEKMRPYWLAALMEIPPDQLHALGDMDNLNCATHAVLAATMWRVGFACWLQTRSELIGNHNLRNFIDGHQALEKALFDRWVELKAPPSDKDLFGDELAVLTVESMCDRLYARAQMPVFGVPYLSPAAQRDVPVRLVHRRRTPPLNLVRQAVLPRELLAGATPRANVRVALAYVLAKWQREPEIQAAVVSGGWLLPVESDSPAYACRALLNSSQPLLRQWVAELVSIVALQCNFEDSVWLLRELVVRWRWLQRAAAAQTSSVCMGEILDRRASDALSAGQWIPENYQPLDALGTPAPRAAVPANAPPWVKDVSGPLRFAASYPAADGSTVKLVDHIYPDALSNFQSTTTRSQCYLVLAAARLRVYELQRLASQYDKPLRAAFDKAMADSRDEGREASEPLRHKRRDVCTRIKHLVGDPPAQPASGINAFDRSTFSSPLSAGCDVMTAADKLAVRWPAVDTTVAEMLAADVHLTESIAQELIPPFSPDKMPALDVRPMGVPYEARRNDRAYNVRCALFELLELAYRFTIEPDVSDAYWFTAQKGQPLRPLDQFGPLAGAVACEDTLPDISQYVGLSLLHENGHAAFTSQIPALTSWISQVDASLLKACYIRDWAVNHAHNCRHSEYAAWASQAVLASMQGTYRHASSTQRFDRVLSAYAHLRPQNTHTSAGREIVARYLVANTFVSLIAAREYHMFSIQASPSQYVVIAAAWPNFPYVQQRWIPQQGERMRDYIRASRTEQIAERRVREMARDEEVPDSADNNNNDDIETTASDKLVPRVFRHLPQSWAHQMLSLFCRIESERCTDEKLRNIATGVGDSGNPVSLLPPIVNKVPGEIKHAIVRYFSQTSATEPIRLQWFSDCGVSPQGLALLSMINALYTAQERPIHIRALMSQLSSVDFLYIWTTLHIMTERRDTYSVPVTWETAQRQYVAAQCRSGDMKNPPPPFFTHMQFCHPLGCPGAQSYCVPFADNGHYGAQEVMNTLELGRVTCGRHKSRHIFEKLVRRVNETQVTEMTASLTAIMAALDTCDNADERRSLVNELQRQRDKLITHQSTNVRATISVMMTRPCNEAPVQDIRVVGALVVRFNSIHPREPPRVYTACPNCAMPTLHSMDRYGPNGFMCGQCNREARWAEHGRWCIGCGLVEQAEQLPQLTGESEAEARAGRTEHQIQGSTQQARSLKAHVTRERHDKQLRRAASVDEARKAAANQTDHGEEVDRSDTLDQPMESQQLEWVVSRNKEREKKYERRPTPRRANTASQLQLGMSLSRFHPMPLKMRMDPFNTRLVYDDRVGGHFTTLLVSICGPCENRIRVPTLSLQRILEQTNAPPDEIYVHGVRISVDGSRARPRMRVRRAPRPKEANKRQALPDAQFLSHAETEQLLTHDRQEQ